MKSTIVVFFVVLTTFAFVQEKKQVGKIPVKGYELAWSDEFSGNSLDRTKWNYRATGKRGDAFNSRNAVCLDGKGNLVIEIKLKGDSVLTGMISTENLFETRYGYFECRAKLTKINGVWPAFWLQSQFNKDHGTPEKNGAEIDIFEYFPNLKKDSVSQTLHWGGYGPTHKQSGVVWAALKKTADGFHSFGLEWTDEGYATYVDGVQTYKGSELVSKVPEFIILSVEANKQVAGPLNRNELPDKFVVDYVRVYKRKG